MKRFLLLLLTAVLLLSACTSAPTLPEATQDPDMQSTAEPTAAPTQAPPVLQGERTEDGAFLSLGALVNTDGYCTWYTFFCEEGLGVYQENADTGTYRVGLYDLYTGQVEVRFTDTIPKTSREMGYSAGMEMISTDPLLLYNAVDQIYTLFDRQMQPVRIMPIAGLGAYSQAYCIERDCIYYLTQQYKLKRYNTSTGESEALPLDIHGSYAFIHSITDGGHIIALSSWEEGEEVVRYYSTDTGEELPVVLPNQITLYPDGSYTYTQEKLDNRLYMGSVSKPRAGTWLVLESKTELRNTRLLPEIGMVFTLDCNFEQVSELSNTCTGVYALKAYDVAMGQQVNTAVRTRTAAVSDYDILLTDACYNQALSLCALVIPSAEAGGEVLLWDMSVQGTVSNDLSMDNKIVSQAFGDLPNDINAYAQKLAEYYGVNIHTGEEAVWDFPDYVAEPLTDIETIREVLEQLEKVLSIYPKGFFRQLVYGDVYSVDIFLCGSLTSDNSYSLETCDAFAVVEENRQMIVLDANKTFRLRDTVIHEFSHAIDHRLEQHHMLTGDYVFNHEVWRELNPSGFDYFYAYRDEDGNSYDWMPVFDHTPADPKATVDVNEIYFIDTYSMTFPTEDRARLLEYASMEEIPFYFNSTHMQAKLRYYSQAIRLVFDTTDWPNVFGWEKALH